MGRSSRHAWRMLKRMDGTSELRPPSSAINPDEIARNFKERGTHIPQHAFEVQIRKEYQELFNSYPEHSELSSEILPHEVLASINTIKQGKAAGIDGVYPDMIKHLGPRAVKWLANAFTQTILSGRLCYLWKRAKVLAILKPGKPADDPNSYRPISLLCCLYKLFERVILFRLSPVFEAHIPHEQAGFREHRGTEEQVVALTSLIESGFELKKKRVQFSWTSPQHTTLYGEVD